MSKNKSHNKAQQSSFAEPGDAGSFIVDIEGKFCGVLYGSTSSFLGPRDKPHYANAGLVMDIGDIANSIKLHSIASNRLPAQLCLPGQ